LFVHPGVQKTFGLVALESQACGTAVVGIRGSYMDRIILNDQRFWANDNSADAIENLSAQNLEEAGRSRARNP
jgi:alpha-1,6-mannosyltransferase